MRLLPIAGILYPMADCRPAKYSSTITKNINTDNGAISISIIPGYEVYTLCKLCSLLYCGHPEMKDHECPIKDYKEVEHAPALYLQNLLLYTFSPPAVLYSAGEFLVDFPLEFNSHNRSTLKQQSIYSISYKFHYTTSSATQTGPQSPHTTG